MNRRETRPIKLGFPFDIYLKQLFSGDTYVRYINPFSFWHRYKINHLETCCQQDVTQHLERCYQLKSPSPKSISSKNKMDCHRDSRGHSLEQLSLNTILIIQPTTKLKYRSIIYQTEKFLVISIDRHTFNTNLSKFYNHKHTSRLENINTLENFSSN